MKKLEVIIPTMYRDDIKFLDAMNLQTDAVVVNQNNSIEDVKRINYNNHSIKFISNKERGVSRSRNLAIKNADADICLLADDDVVFEDDYSEKVIEAHEKYPEADIITFVVERYGDSNRQKSFRKNKSWDKYLTSMKISAVEISFKRKSIVDNNIKFNENIGPGEKFFNGEESILLYEALKSGLKILYLPIKIAEVDMADSNWFEGYNKKYFQSYGAKYYNMSKRFYPLLILQYAVRKRDEYGEQMPMFKAIKYLFQGAKLYKNDYEK